MNKHLECAHDRLQPGANFLPVSMMHERVGSKNKIIPGVCSNCPSHVCLATCSGAQAARSGREGGTEGGREGTACRKCWRDGVDELLSIRRRPYIWCRRLHHSDVFLQYKK